MGWPAIIALCGTTHSSLVACCFVAWGADFPAWALLGLVMAGPSLICARVLSRAESDAARQSARRIGVAVVILGGVSLGWCVFCACKGGEGFYLAMAASFIGTPIVIAQYVAAATSYWWNAWASR